MPPQAESVVEIDAPIARVWAVMTDVARYGEWNPFVVGLRPEGELSVGARIRLEVRWRDGGGARTVEQVTRLEAPAEADGVSRAAMEYVFLGPLARLGLVRGARLQTLEQAPGGPTRYRSYERFRGLLAWAVPLAKVQDGFDRHARALKARAESSA